MRLPIRLAFGAILFFMLTMPWLPAMLRLGINIHDASRMVQLVLFGFCALMVLLDRGQVLTVFWPASRLTQWLAMLAVVLALTSVLMSPSPDWSFKELMVWIGWLGVVAIIAQVNDRADQTQLIRMVLGSLMIQALMLLFLVAMAYLLKQPNMLAPVQFSMGYGNRRFMNHTQTVALSLGSAALLMPELTTRLRNLVRVPLYLALALGWTLLLATMGRATLLGLVVASFTLLVLYGKHAILLLKPLIKLACLGAVFWLLLFYLIPGILGVPISDVSIQGRKSVNARAVVWAAAWDMFLSHPWLGAGPMQFSTREIFEHVPQPDAAHPHNIYLQTLSEWGAPFALLIVALVSTVLYRLWRYTQATAIESHVSPPGWGLVLTFTLVAVGVDAGLSGNFVSPVPMVWTALPLGLALGFLAAQRPSVGSLNTRRVHAISAALLVAALHGMLWWRIWPEAQNVKAFVAATHKQFPAATFQPRFWAHGWHQ